MPDFAPLIPGRLPWQKRLVTPGLILTPLIIYFGAVLYLASNAVDLMLGLFSTAIFAVISLTWQAILWCVEKRQRWPLTVRTPLYLLPLIVVLVLPVFGVGVSAARPNQKSPARSPSGLYEVAVTSQHHWDFTVREISSGKETKQTTKFSPLLNVYWLWDQADRLWIYNSDDGEIYYLAHEGRDWLFNHWVKDKPREGYQPPTGLRPLD